MNSYKILVVEDEKNICNFMKMIFETNDYQVIFAQNGKNGLTMFFSHNPDLVILDLGLPDMDGVDVIREIRAKNDTPIVVLSARTDESDKVEALDLGANDYVTKPFGTAELLARVRATLRNSRFQGTGKSVRESFSLYDMEIEYDARRVSIAGEEIKLTQTEYNIVQLLALHAGKVLTYAEIIKKVWGYSDYGSVKKLQVNMANIRRKMENNPAQPQYIFTEVGVGYRIVDGD